MPLISHRHGVPQSTSDMWDATSLAMNPGYQGHLLGFLGGTTAPGVGGYGTFGAEAMDAPATMEEETPYLPPRPPAFPQPEAREPRMLMADAINPKP